MLHFIYIPYICYQILYYFIEIDHFPVLVGVKIRTHLLRNKNTQCRIPVIINQEVIANSLWISLVYLSMSMRLDIYIFKHLIFLTIIIYIYIDIFEKRKSGPIEAL